MWTLQFHHLQMLYHRWRRWSIMLHRLHLPKFIFSGKRAKVITAAKRQRCGFNCCIRRYNYRRTCNWLSPYLHGVPSPYPTCCLANNGKCEFERCSGTLWGYKTVSDYHWAPSWVYPAIIFKVFFEERITGGFYPVDDTERTKHQSRSGAYSGDVASFPNGLSQVRSAFRQGLPHPPICLHREYEPVYPVGDKSENTHVGNDEVACGSFLQDGYLSWRRWKPPSRHVAWHQRAPGASISSKPVPTITNTALPEGWADGGMLILISVIICRFMLF